MAVPLGPGHPPSTELLVNGAATGWTPSPDFKTMCTLLGEHLKRLKGSTSSGSDVDLKCFVCLGLSVGALRGCMLFFPLPAQLFLLFLRVLPPFF